jgi:hypothetical protein
MPCYLPVTGRRILLDGEPFEGILLDDKDERRTNVNTGRTQLVFRRHKCRAPLTWNDTSSHNVSLGRVDKSKRRR